MKKATKLFAALSAAMLLGCAVSAPAYAAETAPQGYLLGDVDMDGKVTVDDAWLVLREYSGLMIKLPASLTADEAAVGNVLKCDEDPSDDHLCICDALCILQFYTETLENPGQTVTWESFLGEKFVENRVLPVDRGDYELKFSEEKGDYIVVKKG